MIGSKTYILHLTVMSILVMSRNYPKAIMGNIYKENLIKPKKGIKCPFDICACGPDVRINKYEDVDVT